MFDGRTVRKGARVIASTGIVDGINGCRNFAETGCIATAFIKHGSIDGIFK